jgi:hypothetical protein
MMPISWILPRARAMFPDRTALIDGEIRYEHHSCLGTGVVGLRID